MRAMKIGVDARLLSRPLSGIGRYTLEMCKSLSKIDGLALHLYSPAPVKPEFFSEISFENYRFKNLESGILRQLWSETYLPMWARQDDVDVFWGPAHRLPRLLPKSMPCVVTIHDLVWKHAGETMRPLSRKLEQYQMPHAVRMADYVVADSEATALDVAEEFTFAKDKLAIVPLGSSFVGGEEPAQLPGELEIDFPYILFVGTLEPRKNLARLLSAYAALGPDVKAQAKLVIVGAEGWGGVDILETIAQLEMEKNVKLIGYSDDAILTTLYANALFLVMPSLYEGFGLPLVEAMTHGTPVLTANNSSMPEVAGDAGLLVEATDVDAITAGLEQLITDIPLRNRLAANARINARRFDWDRSAQKIAQIFECVISLRAQRVS